MHSEQEDPSAADTSNKSVHKPGFIGRILITDSIGALFLLLVILLWFASSVVLLVFASILMAIQLHDICSKVENRMRVSGGGGRKAACAGGDGTGESTYRGFTQFHTTLAHLREYFERNRVSQYATRYLPSPEHIGDSPGAIAAQDGSVFFGVFGALGNVAIFLFLSIYLASQPSAIPMAL